MKKILFAVCILIAILTINVTAYADEIVLTNDGIYTGLEIMSEEERETFHNTIPMIVDVKPNSIALSRLSGEESVLFENVEVVEIGEEMVYSMPGEEAVLMSETAFPLADAVDVSESLTFPPIGDQGQTGSCLPWAFCYYQFTNNTCLVRNLQAKTPEGEAIMENIIAPGFIYSLVNEGADSGSSFDEVTYAIAHSGCPNADIYALEITDESLKQWSSNINVWYDAMYNKPKVITHIPIPTDNIVDGETDKIIQVKQMLSNGYVVTFSTYVASWVFTNRTTTGEYACSYMKNDKQGPHAMSIVGYDDDFWVDINDNNSIDDGEVGAFKLVNSWGYESSLFPNGYAWVPYDAFGNDSAVINMATDRVSVMKEDFYIIIPWKNYTPLLVAEVEITASNREHLVVAFNVTNNINDEIDYLSPVLLYENINTIFYRWKSELPWDNPTNIVNFSGTTGEETIIIPFDLTSIVGYETDTITPDTSLRVYARVDDGNSDDDLSVSYNMIRVVEPMTGKTANYAGGVISKLEHFGDVEYVDLQITPLVGVNKMQSITLKFNGDVKPKSINENIYLITPENENVYPHCEVIDNKILIYSPNDGYDFNSTYRLHITRDVISKGGNSLKQDVEIPIYIVTEVTEVILPWKE